MGPGRITAVVGSIAAVAGVIVILSSFGASEGGEPVVVGGVLVLGGLLLRIEGAIWARGDDGGEIEE